MSFASEIKEELCSRKSIGAKCCACAELAAFVLFSARFEDGCLKIPTENTSVAKQIINLLKHAYAVKPEVSVKKNLLFININQESSSFILKELNILREDGTAEFRIYNGMIKNDCCAKSFVRGAFLSCGSMTSPEKDYHLEFVTHRKRLSGDLEVLLKKFGLAPKCVLRKSNYVIYFKAADAISDVLSLIGAVNSLMEFENTVIIKDVKNNINRRTNFENANMNKTADAAAKQLAAIKKIKNAGMLDSLKPELKEIALLRLDNPEIPLSEICGLLTDKVSKSGANHRFRKLISIAEGL